MHLKQPLFRTSLVLLLLIAAVPAQAALNAYAELTLDGVPLDGDVTQATIGGVDVSANHLEIYRYDQLNALAEKGKGTVVGPLTLLKRIDRASPLLIQALLTKQRVAGTLKIFDNDPDTGETRLRYTVELVDGQVSAVEQTIPDAFDPEQATRPPLEVLRIEPGALIWTDEINGITTPSTIAD